MWPYLTMTLVALAGGLVLGEWKKSKVGMEILYWGCCVAMIVIAGLRNPYVGGDTMPYRGYFGYVALGTRIWRGEFSDFQIHRRPAGVFGCCSGADNWAAVSCHAQGLL